jgi:hypothetical protein
VGKPNLKILSGDRLVVLQVICYFTYLVRGRDLNLHDRLRSADFVRFWAFAAGCFRDDQRL